MSDRQVGVALGGRFADEVLSGLPDVLMPTIRAQLGLSYSQIGLLQLAMFYVAAVVEPIGGLLIDLWQRRWLMAFGAAAIGLAVVVMGLAPTFLVLLAGFAIYGLGSGPLAHTADVVLVETHPKAPDQIFSRATFVDTVGAMLAPLSVAATVWLGLEWRWLMILLGLSSLIYAAIILGTRFPPPAGNGREDGQTIWRSLWANIRAVLSSRTALIWLLFLLIFDILEAPLLFKTVWLREQAGMSQALIGVYLALEMGVGLVTLLYLERWRQRASYKRVLGLASLGLLLLFPAWLLLPGIAARFVLGIPLTFFLTVFWPIGRAQLLVSVPGRAGTVTAVSSTFGFIPLSLLFGLLAEAIGLTMAMLLVLVPATVGLLVVVWWLPDGS